jgi:hypothetical protein
MIESSWSLRSAATSSCMLTTLIQKPSSSETKASFCSLNESKKMVDGGKPHQMCQKCSPKVMLVSINSNLKVIQV